MARKLRLNKLNQMLFDCSTEIMEKAMMECELIPHCIFFNARMKIEGATHAELVDKFCTRDHSSCARYMIFESLGSDKVPDNLRPDMKLEAVSIIDYSLDFWNRSFKYKNSIDRALRLSVTTEIS